MLSERAAVIRIVESQARLAPEHGALRRRITELGKRLRVAGVIERHRRSGVASKVSEITPMIAQVG